MASSMTMKRGRSTRRSATTTRRAKSVRPGASSRSARSTRTPPGKRGASRPTANPGKRRPKRSTGTRPASAPAIQPEEPMEFVELPPSGSAGSSWEPDSYTPKADLQPRRSRFFGLFRR